MMSSCHTNPKTMAAAAEVIGDGNSHPMYYDEIHITDSGALIPVSNDVNDMISDTDEPDLSTHLAELASELLRLQEQGNSAEPRRTGVFSPESLRRWAREVPCDAPVTPLASPATPAPVMPSPLDSLPTPTSTSDGRSDAAEFLRDRIQKMQLHDESGVLTNAATTDSAAAENRIADFSHRSDYEQLRIEKGEAEAEAALLSAELITLRGRHEDEKRQLMKTVKDLRRWNEELESRMSLQRLDSKANNGTETTINNGRSRSGSSQTSVEDRDTKFGFRVRALAQRWTSPHPRSSPCTIDGDEEVSYPSSSDHHEFPRGISGGENTEQVGSEVLRSTIGDGDESQSTIALLQEQLRQSEHRAAILEQRLAIVKESGDAVIQSLNEELADLADDRAKSEAAMIKELSILDNQRREERSENEKRIQEWIAHDAHRKAEVEEYEARIKSLLETVRMMSEGVADCEIGTNSSSWDKEAEIEVYDELINYIQLLGKGNRSLISSINDAFDLEFNANPNVADNMLEYYRSRPELRDFTLKSELPRMHYEVLVVDDETGKEMKLNSTDEIRSYFASLEKSNVDDEVDILLRAANQSLLADPLGILSGEGDGRLVHSGRFHSTLIATDCSFKLDLRREGQRRVKVQCELAICVPSGSDGSIIAAAPPEDEGKEEKNSATLELARAILVIQFSPSPTSTPSGPLVKYALMDIKPTISDHEDGTDTARAIQSAAAVLARDRYSHVQCASPEVRPHVVKSRFFARVKQFSGRRGSGSDNLH